MRCTLFPRELHTRSANRHKSRVLKHTHTNALCAFISTPAPPLNPPIVRSAGSLSPTKCAHAGSLWNTEKKKKNQSHKAEQCKRACGVRLIALSGLCTPKHEEALIESYGTDGLMNYCAHEMRTGAFEYTHTHTWALSAVPTQLCVPHSHIIRNMLSWCVAAGCLADVRVHSTAYNFHAHKHTRHTYDYRNDEHRLTNPGDRGSLHIS